jgi:hypothetical protein
MQPRQVRPPSDWDARRRIHIGPVACQRAVGCMSHRAKYLIAFHGQRRASWRYSPARPIVRKAFGRAATMSWWRKRALDPELETVQPRIGLRCLDLMQSRDIGDPQ